MVSLKRLSAAAALLSSCSIDVLGLTLGGRSYAIANPGRRELLQDLVRTALSPFSYFLTLTDR